MTPQTRQQTITIQILQYISRRKGYPTLKFGRIQHEKYFF